MSKENKTPAGFAAYYFEDLQNSIRSVDVNAVGRVIETLDRAYDEGRTVFIAGNGGSASTASHMASDLSKTVLGHPTVPGKQGFRAISLTDNIPLFTAWANDEGFAEIFAGQLRNLARPGDVLIVISVSGNSENLVRGVHQAKQIGMTTLGFLGHQGGKLVSMVDSSVLVQGSDYGPIEDSHLVLDHLITGYFKRKVLGPAAK